MSISSSKRFTLGLLAFATSAGLQLGAPTTAQAQSVFRQPVNNIKDPNILKACDNQYYSIYTQNGITLQSSDVPQRAAYGGFTTIFSPSQAQKWGPNLDWMPVSGGNQYQVSVSVGADASHMRNHVWTSGVYSSCVAPTAVSYTDAGEVNTPSGQWSIDGEAFKHGNGNYYYMWAGNDNDGQGEKLFVQQMDTASHLIGSPVVVVRPTAGWETIGGAVAEAPTFLVHNSKLSVLYSASSTWTQDYCLGNVSISTTADPLVASNWTKSSGCVFAKNTAANVYGPGSASFFKSPNGSEDWFAYHAWTSNACIGTSCEDNRVEHMQKVSGWNADNTPQFPTALGLYNDIAVPGGSTTGDYAVQGENGNFFGGAKWANSWSASWAMVAGYMGNAGSGVQLYNVRGRGGGSKNVRFHYAGGAGAGTFSVSVNGGTAFNVSFPGTANWDTFNDVTVAMNLNNNDTNNVKLTFSSGAGINLDYLYVN